MNSKEVARDILQGRIEKRIIKHMHSMTLAASVGAKEVETFYAVRVNRLRGFLFELQQVG